MKKFKSRLVIWAIIASLILVIVLFFQFNSQFSVDNVDQIIQERAIVAKFIENSSEIQRVWWEGEESNEWKEVKDSCLKKYKITNSFDESLLRCNPILLNCVSEYSKNNKLKIAPEIKFVKNENAHGYLVTLLSGENNFKILLKDFCHESYLEQRVYGYAAPPKANEGDDFLFDTFNQNIYFDRHLVTNREVNEFVLYSNDPIAKNIAIKSGNDLFMPAVRLNLSQMVHYCNYRGKELISALVYDAATFLPHDMLNKNSKTYPRTPYFWSNKKVEKLDNCENIFTSECLNKTPYRLNSVGPTWAGLFDSMGGPMEVVRNPIEPEKNLKVSSYYLPRNSIWHRLGLRKKWTGEGSDLRFFDVADLDLNSNITTLDVGFRCMRKAQ